MRDLNFETKKLCERNKYGSYSTQANRQKIMNLVANQIHGLGFRNLKLGNIKTKHIEALINHWKLEDLSPGTLKNRMSCLRWLAEKLNKPSLIAKDNAHYGIERRTYVTNVSKARELDIKKLEKITDPYVKFSLIMQEKFGLRREESIKFIAEWADRGDYILLKPSWCKGGRARRVPIRNEQQRTLLNEIISFTKGNSLIPPNLTYVQQKNRYEDQTAKAGLCKMHGLRHAFAQLRYFELTGQLAPSASGKTSKELTLEEKALDRQARFIISEELGHEREQITAVYLGR